MTNLRLAFRNLAHGPFVTGVAVLSLALGIGANAAMFSVVDQVLLSALPVEEPGRLVNLSAPGPKGGSQSSNQAGGIDDVFSYPMFRDLEASPGAGFAGLAAHRRFGANLATGTTTLSGEGMLVSGSYFQVLGLAPHLGRLLSPADDVNPGEHTVAVAGHRFWQEALGADPAALNRTIVVNGVPMTIVGVAPRGFDGTTLGASPDVFVPLSMRAALEAGISPEIFEDRRNYWIYVFGRLAPGATLQQAGAALNTTYGNIVNEVEAPLQEGASAESMERFRAKQVLFSEGSRGQSELHEETRTPLWLLFGITGVVLLIACANIANLLLARGAHRMQELAVRNSLGAGRARLVRQLLVESLLLGVLGGLVGLAVAHWTLGFIGSILPSGGGREAAEMLSLELNPQVVAFTALLAVVTGLLFGTYPALHATRPDIVTLLKVSARGAGGARSAARLRSALVTAQIALSMALLVAAGLFIRSLMNVARIDLGLDASNVVTFSISSGQNGYTPEETMALFQRVEEEVRALPGVTSVSGAMVPILTGSSWGNDVSVEGFESGPDTDDNARMNRVEPGFFATLGIPLMTGREFAPSDVESASRVAVVNEAFTEKFGLGREAVGKYMTMGSGELDMEIVGVVQNASYSSVKADVPAMYFTPFRQRYGPLAPGTLGRMAFYARTSVDPASLMGDVREIVRRLDANLPVEYVTTLQEQARENVFLDRMISILAGAFAFLATLLAAIGLYGVLAYTVAQRTREIALRMALGSGRARVRRMVLAQVGRMLVLGGVIGLVAAVALARAAQSLLFGLEGTDPFVVVAVTTLLGAVALGAGLIPAERASRVEPMEALRYE